MSGDYYEQDIKPPVRKRLTQMVIAALLVTSFASLIAVKILSDQRQQAIETAATAVSAQETAVARSNTVQQVDVVREPTINITPTVIAVTAQSHSRELAYAALAQLDTDPERSILLAIEANRSARTPEAQDAIRRSLSVSRLRHKLSLNPAAARTALFSPDGAYILTHAGWTAQVWNLDNGQMQYTLSGHDGDVMDASYSHDGKHILTVSADKTVRVWRADSGALLFGLETGGDIPLLGRFSPDDLRFAVAAKDGTVQIMDATGGALLAGFHVPDIEMWEQLSDGLEWSPDGQNVLTGFGRAVRVWDSRDGSLRFQEYESPSGAATFSPDSRYIASPGPVQVQVWSIGSGQKICNIDNVTATQLQFNPRGDQLLISDWNAGRVTLWDLWAATAKCTLGLTVPSGYRAGIISPDGEYLALQDTKAISLWIDEGYGRGLQSVATLCACGNVIAMQFSADSRYLLTHSFDGDMQVWAVVSATLPGSIDDLMALAQTRVTRKLTCAERKIYLHDTGSCS